MPNLGIGLFIGDADADAQIGPPIDGVLRAESGAFLRTEDNNFLAFD